MLGRSSPLRLRQLVSRWCFLCKWTETIANSRRQLRTLFWMDDEWIADVVMVQWERGDWSSDTGNPHMIPQKVWVRLYYFHGQIWFFLSRHTLSLSYFQSNRMKKMQQARIFMRSQSPTGDIVYCCVWISSEPLSCFLYNFFIVSSTSNTLPLQYVNVTASNLQCNQHAVSVESIYFH